MVTIDDTILGFWYVELRNGNWMASLHRRPEGMLLKYRFRYYKDNKAFDSQDEKSGYTVTHPGQSPEVIQTLIQTVRDLIAHLKITDATDSWELLRGTSTTGQFTEQFLALPFVHQRLATPEEVVALNPEGKAHEPPKSHSGRN